MSRHNSARFPKAILSRHSDEHRATPEIGDKLPYNSSSFWIPGGILLLIVTALLAVVMNAFGLTTSSLTIARIIRWILRLVFFIGMASICIGSVIGLRRRKQDQLVSRERDDAKV